MVEVRQHDLDISSSCLPLVVIPMRPGQRPIQGLEAMNAGMITVSWSRCRRPAPCFLISNRFGPATELRGPHVHKNEWHRTDESDEEVERLRRNVGSYV